MGVVECDWCVRAEMIDQSGIGRVEWNGWDITGLVWTVTFVG